MIIYLFDKNGHHCTITINEIRIDNARSLAKTLGSNSAFGQRLGMDNSQVSQLIGKNPKKIFP